MILAQELGRPENFVRRSIFDKRVIEFEKGHFGIFCREKKREILQFWKPVLDHLTCNPGQEIDIDLELAGRTLPYRLTRTDSGIEIEGTDSRRAAEYGIVSVKFDFDGTCLKSIDLELGDNSQPILSTRFEFAGEYLTYAEQRVLARTFFPSPFDRDQGYVFAFRPRTASNGLGIKSFVGSVDTTDTLVHVIQVGREDVPQSITVVVGRVVNLQLATRR